MREPVRRPTEGGKTVNRKLGKHKLAAAGVLAAVLVGGGASIAAASSNSTTTAANSTTADQAWADGETADGPDGGAGSVQDASFTGSVAAPAENEQAGGTETAATDAQEKATLEKLATVTPQQAEQAAVAAVPGTVSATDLGNEDGFVVYSVDIKSADGSVTEVKIDAGNAAVLAQGPADSADQPEGPNDVQD
jgi:uncharacterized membrane protein YkoI